VDRRRFLRTTLTWGAGLLAPAVLRRRVSLGQDGPTVSGRAVDLVASTPVIDMLGLLTLDWPQLYAWFRHPEEMDEAAFRALERTGVNVYHPAVEMAGHDPAAIARRWIDGWNRLVTGNPCFFHPALDAADLEAATRLGRIALIVGFQNSTHFRRLADVAEFHRLGQRVSQLTYNGRNHLGCGAKVAPDRGLTDFGAAVVTEMNRLGMAVDVSHCGERTAADAIAVSTRPVLATHANCRALAPAAPRNRSDALIRRLAAGGGVMGITAVRAFVGGRSPDLGDLLDHFDHVAKLVGPQHAGLGSDLAADAVDPLTGRPQAAYAIRGLDPAHRVFQVADGLLSRGWRETDVAGVLGGNFLRALRAIWGEGHSDGARPRDPFCPAPKPPDGS
jgi:membrane dipeptidase